MSNKIKREIATYHEETFTGWLMSSLFYTESFAVSILNTFNVRLKETGLFFMNKTKTGWSTLQSMKKLIIKFKRNVECLLLVLRTFTEFQLNAIYQSLHFPLIIIPYLPLHVPNFPRLKDKKASKTDVRYMAIIYGYIVSVYICMQSGNFKKFLKLCVESTIYYTCDLIKEGEVGKRAQWSGAEHVYCKQSVNSNVYYQKLGLHPTKVWFNCTTHWI